MTRLLVRMAFLLAFICMAAKSTPIVEAKSHGRGHMQATVASVAIAPDGEAPPGDKADDLYDEAEDEGNELLNSTLVAVAPDGGTRKHKRHKRLPNPCKVFFANDCQMKKLPGPSVGAVEEAFTNCCRAGSHPQSLCKSLVAEALGQSPRTGDLVDDRQCGEFVRLFSAHVQWVEDDDAGTKLPNPCKVFFANDCRMQKLPGPSVGAVEEAFTNCCRAGSHPQSLCKKIVTEALGQSPRDGDLVDDRQCGEFVRLFSAHVQWVEDQNKGRQDGQAASLMRRLMKKSKKSKSASLDATLCGKPGKDPNRQRAASAAGQVGCSSTSVNTGASGGNVRQRSVTPGGQIGAASSSTSTWYR